MSNIKDLVYPSYLNMVSKWQKWRLTYAGGDDFINEYLKMFSVREDPNDFNTRKEITYVPAFAKAALNDVKNAIFQRAADIYRKSSSTTFMQSINGEAGGVDLKSKSMSAFMGGEVLPELLSMAQVGVYVDNHKEIGETLAQANGKHPYLYIFTAESIRNYTYNEQNMFEKLLLKESALVFDEDTSLPTKTEEQYRYLERLEDGIKATIYDKDGKEIGGELLDIPEIPFVILSISDSLLTDIANYQIAHLNLASSDIYYAITSNYPFYTEQFDPRMEIAALLRKAISEETTTDGKVDTEKVAKKVEVELGTRQGRRYPINTERPGFIHPSPEPLRASMDKQDTMKKEIRELINLSLANIKSTMTSAEGREIENEGLEAGLANIGLTLEAGERKIEEFWRNYENNKTAGQITYPKMYKLKSDSERLKEAEEKLKIAKSISSQQYKREVAKDIIFMTIATKVTPQVLDAIIKEIEASKTPLIDVEQLLQAKEMALISDEFATVALGLPAEEAAKGAVDHEKRLIRIAIAQSGNDTNSGDDNPDNSPVDDSQSRNQRKLDSQNADSNPNGTKKVRGKARRF
jgi:hypothetical protein